MPSGSGGNGGGGGVVATLPEPEMVVTLEMVQSVEIGAMKEEMVEMLELVVTHVTNTV